MARPGKLAPGVHQIANAETGRTKMTAVALGEFVEKGPRPSGPGGSN